MKVHFSQGKLNVMQLLRPALCAECVRWMDGSASEHFEKLLQPSESLENVNPVVAT